MIWETKYVGNIWRVQQGNHDSGKVFEKAVRAPGSRLIIVKDGKILLSREKRRELGGKVDFRLPGGKVFDTNEEYVKYLESGLDITQASRTSIAKEGLEEVGLNIVADSLTLIGVDVLGSTCEWDLYYWFCEDFTEDADGAQHHETEADEIEGSVWVSFDEAKKIALDPEQFSESRSARMLLSYIANPHAN
ncbi:NUDIX domain-containing protein [Candidatus Saccharibacteria bacterium]|nr:NUDIX domain-containing protein [Candidatus Saccharibacteria bacterium]